MATKGKTKKVGKKKEKKNIGSGNVFIQSTFNNTIVTVTDRIGNVVSWASSGTVGFKGTKRGHPLLLKWLQVRRQSQQMIVG